MLESTATNESNATNGARGPLTGKRIAFVGKLGGMNRREATALTRMHGAIPVTRRDKALDLIVIGADELPLTALTDEELLSEDLRQSSDRGQLQIIHETELWQWLGLVPDEGAIRQLYTPAMLADLLGVPITVIRRWHRRGLIVPVREVHRLAYFDFQEVATARHLAKLLEAGASAKAIEDKLAQLGRWVPDVDRPLTQLSIIVEGRDLLLRQGEGLVDASGQRRFDFEAAGVSDDNATGGLPHGPTDPAENAAASVVSFDDFRNQGQEAPLAFDKDDLLSQAAEQEERGLLEEAVDTYRTILAIMGPDAIVNFYMAELLYRLGDVSAARERYYSTLELDEDIVEARANLGCVLAETGQSELAVAAFQGALSRHDGYPDVHYHLARTLDELGRNDEALDHWQSFLTLAPDSPWATEAKDRLGIDVDNSDEFLSDESFGIHHSADGDDLGVSDDSGDSVDN